MRNALLNLFTFFILCAGIQAQETSSFFATMDAKDAIQLQLELPNEINIIATKNNQSAVFISEYAALEIAENMMLHGPGYVFKGSQELAIKALDKDYLSQQNRTLSFTITENIIVQEAIDMVDVINIENEIINLQNYGTRYHTKPSATEAVFDLKDKWEAMALASGRTDVSVRIFNHTNTNMPSVILTIEGAETPDDYIIVGGHMDSSNSSNQNNAPGADDNASGIATLIEMTRVLLDMDFVPKKTIEFMAFAAEEIGLVGSGEVAQEYGNNGINVEAFVQFDMTNYKGSSNDVYITTDNYNSASLNGFLYDLMNYYNISGVHQFSYGTTSCNYGCSDHFSWAQEGYDAAFPFEASFGQHNPYIHSTGDTYSVSGNSLHAAKFAKLGIEFLIESTKSFVLGSTDFLDDNFEMLVKNKTINYRLVNSSDTVLDVQIFDSIGKKIIQKINPQPSGIISLQSLADGFYIAVFNFAEHGYLTKKFILK